MLVLVVWVMMLIALMATALGSRVGFLLGLVDRLEEELRADAAAEAGVEMVRAMLTEDPTPEYDSPAEPWASLGGAQILQISNMQIDFGKGLKDEDGKLNLNTLPVDVLARFFQKQGLDKEEGRKMAEAVVDWRDEDDDELPHGAEGFYYRGLDDAYDCKDAPFDYLEELLLVRGMTPKFFKACAPFLTVYGSGKLNLNSLSREALIALGLSNQGMNALLALRFGDDGADGGGDDPIFYSLTFAMEELKASLPEEDMALLQHYIQEDVISVSSDAFSLTVKARPENSRASSEVFCILHRKGPVLVWREM